VPNRSRMRCSIQQFQAVHRFMALSVFERKGLVVIRYNLLT
jgi:hypothetical protein